MLRATTKDIKARLLSTASRVPDLEVDNIVIGAGVVGLAIGEKLTRARPTESTFVVEKNKLVGQETRYFLADKKRAVTSRLKRDKKFEK